jgi:hypothetical protein
MGSITLLVLALLAVIGGPHGRGPGDGEDAAIPEGPPPGPGSHPIDAAIDSWRGQLLGAAGVEGVGHGLTPDGHDAVLVFISDESAKPSIPAEIEGYPVLIERVPGGFHAT